MLNNTNQGVIDDVLYNSNLDVVNCMLNNKKQDVIDVMLYNTNQDVIDVMLNRTMQSVKDVMLYDTNQDVIDVILLQHKPECNRCYALQHKPGCNTCQSGFHTRNFIHTMLYSQTASDLDAMLCINNYINIIPCFFFWAKSLYTLVLKRV